MHPYVQKAMEVGRVEFHVRRHRGTLRPPQWTDGERINGTGHLFAVATSISRQRKFAVVQINYLYTNDVYLF